MLYSGREILIIAAHTAITPDQMKIGLLCVITVLSTDLFSLVIWSISDWQIPRNASSFVAVV